MAILNRVLHWPRKKVFSYLVKRAGLDEYIKKFGVQTPEELYEYLVTQAGEILQTTNAHFEKLYKHSEKERQELYNERH